MPDWQERIDRETAPAIRAEHELRYAAAAPIVHGGAAWCDLGCGTGLAAGAGLGRAFEGNAVLVDRDRDAVELAPEHVSARLLTTLVADLTNADDLAHVRESALAAATDGSLTVTCFETLEHLATFVPLVELLLELAAQHDATVVLSVPNDAFWAIENPHHRTSWGDGAVAELRSLLPADHLAVQQVALQGSALVREGDTAEETATVSVAAAVPSHFLLAFGPRAGELAVGARVAQVDLLEQRRWERQRESDLRYFAAAADAAASDDA